MTRPIACSVVILTLNEERNVRACLESLTAFEQCCVVDSGSDDATLVIATELDADVRVNPFVSFADQRNWAHENLPLRHDWVLHLDADERMTPQLAAEIADVIQRDVGSVAGYYLAERTLLRGSWLKHAGQFPRYQARLVHRARMKFVDHGHGQRESSVLPFEKLSNPYDHLAFSQGLEHWLRKHVGYARLEAEQILHELEHGTGSIRGLLTTDPMTRRRALKRLAMFMPMRPLLRFLHVLVVNRGLLDGRPGWEYARMMRTFQEMIDLSLVEARSVAPSLADNVAALTDGGGLVDH